MRVAKVLGRTSSGANHNKECLKMKTHGRRSGMAESKTEKAPSPTKTLADVGSAGESMA